MIPFFSTGTVLRLGGERRARARTSPSSSGCPSPASSTGVLCRNIDVDAEARLAEEQADDLEREAMAHERTDGLTDG